MKSRCLLFTILSLLAPLTIRVNAAEQPDVLFISVDDLRPGLGCYGNRRVITPQLDQFAREGVTFLPAYCQAAVCAPSRASVMTGLRPDSTRVWDLRGEFRVNLPGPEAGSSAES